MKEHEIGTKFDLTCKGEVVATLGVKEDEHCKGCYFLKKTLVHYSGIPAPIEECRCRIAHDLHQNPRCGQDFVGKQITGRSDGKSIVYIELKKKQ